MSSITLKPVEETVGSSIDTFNNINSLGRNGASAVVATGTAGLISAAVGSILGLGRVLYALGNTFIDLKDSASVGDREGVACKTANSVALGSLAGLFGTWGTQSVMSLANVATPVAMGTAVSGLGLGFYGVKLGYSVYGMTTAAQFGNELQKEIDKGEAFNWIKDQLTVTAEDEELLQKQNGNVKLKRSDELYEKLLNKKEKIFAFRTDAELAKKLRAVFNDPDAKVNEAEVIEAVQKSNFKAKVKWAFYLIVCLVGIAAFVTGLVLTGPVSPILFAVGALLWFTMESNKIHSAIGDKLWDCYHPKKKDETCTDTSQTVAQTSSTTSDLKKVSLPTQ